MAVVARVRVGVLLDVMRLCHIIPEAYGADHNLFRVIFV